MRDKVRQFIRQNHLIEQGDRIVVGVSGGADSVCLLYMLIELRNSIKFEIFVVHINHLIRGEQADEDEAYVKEICQKLGLHFHAYHEPVEQIAKKEGISTEEAGRKVRYEAFHNEAVQHGCNKVAVAHHMNDTAETVLFNLIRGSGLKGLTGIPAKRVLADGIQIIRPLLCLKREEIESYLEMRDIPYQTDATNLSDDYSRNRLRNQMIPYMKKELNQGVIEHIAKTASNLYEINEYINHMIDNIYPAYLKEMRRGEQAVVKEGLCHEEPVLVKAFIRRVLDELMKEGLKDIDACHVEQVTGLLSAEVGKQLNMPRGLVVRKRYEDLLFSFPRQRNAGMQQNKVCVEVDIEKPARYDLNEIGKTLVVDVIEYKKNMIIPKNAYTKWFDYDKIKNTVFIRTRQTGDYLQVKEDGGCKKLKDYFIDRKIPREERDDRFLLADGNHIMWVFDDRISEAYKINASTKKILVISLIGGKDNG